jgi:CheY-like chemotaxis protein
MPKSGHLSGEGGLSPNDLFYSDLRRALYHLYDPDDLRRNPLFLHLSAEHHGNALALRDLLIAAIAQLKPAAEVSPESSAWRTYRLLRHRFVEQFDQATVAINLGLSIRQMRRQEKQALWTLADVLWRSFHLEVQYAQDRRTLSQADADPATAAPLMESSAPPRDLTTDGLAHVQELSWLSHSIPREVVTVEQLLRTAVGTVESLLQTLRVELTCHMPTGLPPVEVQVGPVRQALLLVLSKAIQAVPGGQLKLVVNAEPQQVTISIWAATSDQAPSFARSDSGDALLAMAQRLAALSGGSLIILPMRPDAVFDARLVLPCAAPLRVLFVDDNADAQHMFQRYLAGTRYTYFSECDPTRVVVATEAIMPTVIVLDVMLPVMDGWELLGRLRTHPRIGQIPVIICTILPLDQLALSLGAAAVLQKPVTREALLQALDREVAALAREAH